MHDLQVGQAVVLVALILEYWLCTSFAYPQLALCSCLQLLQTSTSSRHQWQLVAWFIVRQLMCSCRAAAARCSTAAPCLCMFCVHQPCCDCALSGCCPRSWRQAVLEDDQLLLGLTFKLGVAPPRCSSTHAVRTGRAQHPRLLERVSHNPTWKRNTVVLVQLQWLSFRRIMGYS